MSTSRKPTGPWAATNKILENLEARIQALETGGSADAVARATKPANPLVPVWDGMTALAERLVDVERGIADLRGVASGATASASPMEAPTLSDISEALCSLTARVTVIEQFLDEMNDTAQGALDQLNNTEGNDSVDIRETPFHQH